MYTFAETSCDRSSAPSVCATHELAAEAIPLACITLRDGRVVRVRAARPDDAQAVQTFVRTLSPASRRSRFFSPVLELSPDQLECVTQVRDPRDLQIVAEYGVGAPRIIAMAQHALGEDSISEFALVVDDLFHRQGLGLGLLRQLARHAVRAEVRAFEGYVLADNWPMLTLAARLGFELSLHTDACVMRVYKELDGQALDA